MNISGYAKVKTWNNFHHFSPILNESRLLKASFSWNLFGKGNLHECLAIVQVSSLFILISLSLVGLLNYALHLECALLWVHFYQIKFLFLHHVSTDRALKGTKRSFYLERIHWEKKIYCLHLKWIVKYFLNPLTRNIDFQVIRIR